MSSPSFGFGPDPRPSDMAPPSLHPFTVSAMLVLYTIIYVLPLYISSSSRPSPTLSRDDPRVIRTRVTSVLFSTAICCTITYIVLAQLPDGVLPISPLHAMGYWPVGLAESGSALLLTSILFAGPLYEALLIDGLWEDWKTLEPLTHVWTRWTTWRNIVMGPLTEEMLFRSASVPLLLCALYWPSSWYMHFATPWAFPGSGGLSSPTGIFMDITRTQTLGNGRYFIMYFCLPGQVCGGKAS
ncbi:hypothetical protein CGLO_14494 [Colletotrichum gloeosporioides Cg-14]|uniref:CAAX amino terminal protease n=1 Tax=Colletotrichum gloeosporioides (strain Cg-14) TaxID=1237896 RepID=T0K3W8_COLGC|nr:hypothetical protein CGLO_14494 [Colletotrichum gloeosporioides Cg-14]